jgi:hypothetical protein
MRATAVMLAAALPVAAPAAAPVASSAPEHVALTIYRAPGRGAR